MKKRKLELAFVLAVAALAGLFLRLPNKVEPPSESSPPLEARSSPSPRPSNLEMPTVEMSDDARWLITTAADSYSPRVKVEKAWKKR